MHPADMTERPESKDETAPSDPASGGRLAPKPRGQQPPIDPDARPRTSSKKVNVTPLDEERNARDGIEVDET
jgi:hypothetical protein